MDKTDLSNHIARSQAYQVGLHTARLRALDPYHCAAPTMATTGDDSGESRCPLSSLRPSHLVLEAGTSIVESSRPADDTGRTHHFLTEWKPHAESIHLFMNKYSVLFTAFTASSSLRAPYASHGLVIKLLARLRACSRLVVAVAVSY